MAGRLQKEIRQTRAFQRPEEEALLNIAKTADVMQQALAEMLKKYDLSGTQYNFLRILRGAGAEGLPCGKIGERMITHDPDITRLVDRLEKRLLVTRGRSEGDRRVVTTRITKQGLALLNEIDPPLGKLMERLMGHMNSQKISTLIDLLEETREGAQRASSMDVELPAPNLKRRNSQ
jgi:MarR family transcriptional regulator, organic hydroperoxide resistance regulator